LFELFDEAVEQNIGTRPAVQKKRDSKN